MPKFLIEPHFRLQEWVAEEKDYFREEGLDYKFRELVRTTDGKLSAKYKVVREDKRSIIIETDRDGPTDPQTFTFDDERTMRWQITTGKTISFVRE